MQMLLELCESLNERLRMSGTGEQKYIATDLHGG